jgi:hypothetical protein
VNSSKLRRHNYAANLWIFFSNKNQALYRIEGDVPFMHCVLLEGNPNFVRYRPPALPNPGEAPGNVSGISFSIAEDVEARQTWFCYRRNEPPWGEQWSAAFSELNQRASERQAACCIVTVRELEQQRYLFDNWLVLSRAMTAARSLSRETEAESLAALLSRTRSFELTIALHQPGCDPAIMLAVIARELQLGRLTADLTTTLLSDASILHAEGL